MSERRPPANPFDVFDAPSPVAAANPFDRFDKSAADPGPMPAWLFEHGEKANILSSFGQGAAQGWGAEPLQLGDYATDFLRKAGVFNDLNAAHQSWLKTFNEAMLRPAVSALATTGEAAYRGGAALIRGAQGAVGALGEFAAHPPPGQLPGPLELIPDVTRLARDIAAAPEAFPLGGAELGPRSLRPPSAPAISPEATAVAVRALEPPAIGPNRPQATVSPGVLSSGSRDLIRRMYATPADLAEARSLGVIGEGEEGWKGIGPEQGPEAVETARADAVRAAREAAPEVTLPEVTVTPEERPPPDIHQIARRIAPDTFRQYDALSMRQDTYRRWLDDLAVSRQERAEETAPHAEEIADLQNRLETANQRMTKIYQDRLEPLIAERDRHIADMIGRDTDDMRRVREALQQNDYRMRDLAPDVSAAYRSAQERIPPQTAPEPAQPPVPATVPEAAAAPEITPQAAAAQILTGPQPVTTVHDDAYQKLVAAGRPIEEANAAAALVAAHYDARAARFGGVLGTPEQLYAREGPIVEGVPNQLPIVQFRRDAAAIQRKLPPVAAGETRLWRGNRPGEIGTARQFTNDLPGIALPFARPYEGEISYVDVPTGDLAKYEAKSGAAPGAEFGLPAGIAAKAKSAGEPPRGGISGQTILDNGQAIIRLMSRADASTFIHETGHAWLEELMRDAAHEQAPADLIGDAKTVRDWLGVGEGETIPTRAHEKFARGFERYMMEGRAPSNSLARVFDQFKQWLTKIYQTVGRLRAPITDDIRDVYDRLISLPGREPVIGPDMMIPEQFAAEHEALAERTAPEIAGGMADRVRAEADRVALEKDKDVHDELAGRGTATEPEAAGHPPTDRGPDRNVIEAGPAAGAAPTLESVGAERPSGGTAAAAQPRVAPVADANASYRGADTAFPYVDRAGNIRLDLLGTPQDVNQVIRDAATENNEFIGARRGVISDAEVLRLADALGMDAAQLDRRRLGQAFNAEEVTAARKLLVQSATGVRDAAAKAAMGTDEDVLAFAASIDRHRMIQEQVSGVTAEAGRALRAFAQRPEGMEAAEQIGQFLEEATGRTLNQLRRQAQKAAALPTPMQISKFAKDTAKPTGLFDWLQSAFINALISGPQTHITYGVANTQLSLFKATYEKAFQVGVGAIREAVTGTSGTERAYLGEIPAELWGMIRGQRDGWRAAWDAFRTDQTVALPGETKPPGYAFLRGPIIPGPIGQVIEVPSRGVAAIHSFTRTTSYEMSIAGQAYRIAMREGLTGDAFDRRVGALSQSPTQEMMEEAHRTANENALMQQAPYGGLTSLMQRITNLGVPVPDVPLPGGRSIPMGTLRPLKFVDPFVAISSNIIKSAIVERTPVGLLSSQIRADLSGANGTLAFDRAAGRMLAGTSFYMMAGGLAAEGLITGSAPDNPRKADVLRMTGWQDHSVRIGEMYYSVNRLGVLGMQLGIAADLYNVAYLASSEDMTTAAAAGVHAFSQNILDESFMRGPSDVLKALTDHERYGSAFVRNFLSSAIPFSVGLSQVAHAIDPYSRQARTITDAILRKIPWESETLYPFRDIWGEPMPNREGLIPGVLAIYESRISRDPVNQRLQALGMAPALPSRKIRGIEMSEQQYDDYTRSAGRMAKTQLDKLISSPGFAQMPETVQREIISKTVSGAREAQRSLIMMQNPEIIQKSAAAKTAGLHELRTPP